ncbi:MAG: glycosyltransferase [Bacteroidia bacterium]|nr:glycosyltransferase [Bacteroidia bacterium]
MKILQINSTANLGSTGRIAEQIGDLIIREGWQSIIAYGRGANSSNSELYRIGDAFDVKMHGFQSLILGRHGLGSNNSTDEFINYLAIQKPDIIHIHNLHGYYINFVKLFDYLLKSKIKIVWTFHDCWPITGHCTYFSDIACFKWESECNNCPKKFNYPKSLFFDNSQKNFNLKKKLFNDVPIQIVTVSNWLKAIVEKSFLFNQKISAISNGVDSSIFRIKPKSSFLINKYNLKHKKVLLAASTSWAKQKGFNDYLELASVLNEDIIVVLIGLRLDLIKKLPKNILGIERTENIEELVDWYNVSDIVMNLSIQESFGLTTVEGFMCGKPSIVYNTTASPELIIDTCMGEILEINNINKVNLEIIKLLDKEIDSKKIREIAIDNFDSNKQFRKYINIYKSIV